MAEKSKSGTLQDLEFKMQQCDDVIGKDIDAVDALLKDAGLPKETRKKIQRRIEHSVIVGMNAGYLCGQHGIYVPEAPLVFEKFMPWVNSEGLELNR